MGSDAEGRPFGIILALVALSLILVVIGFVLRRRGALATRGTALGWAILCILPLFGAGAFLFVKHTVQQVTGETQSGVNEDPRRPEDR